MCRPTNTFFNPFIVRYLMSPSYVTACIRAKVHKKGLYWFPSQVKIRGKRTYRGCLDLEPDLTMGSLQTALDCTGDSLMCHGEEHESVSPNWSMCSDTGRLRSSNLQALFQVKTGIGEGLGPKCLLSKLSLIWHCYHYFNTFSKLQDLSRLPVTKIYMYQIQPYMYEVLITN